MNQTRLETSLMLANQTYYNKTTEKAIVAFGNMFANVFIERYDSNGVLQRRVQVPVSYAPKDKFIARMEQQPNIDEQKEELTLPRLAFEISGIERDASRQMNALQKRKAVVNGSTNSAFNPVPYNLKVSLYAVAKTQSDALQMMEQILPTFTPTYTLSMKAMPILNLTDDLPITLDSVQMEDNYDAATFQERRQVIVTFEFTLQLNYFGYVTQQGTGIIKEVNVNFYSGADMAPAEELEGVTVAVNPSTANITDTYTVLTSIEGFNGND
jgi:hypothetical protein